MAKKVSNEWYEQEFASIDLGDKRLKDRFLKMCNDFNKTPTAIVSQAVEGFHQCKAVYRFWKNNKVTSKAFLNAHHKSIKNRLSHNEEYVLELQDSTEINLISHLKTDGLGPIAGDAKLKGLEMHSSIISTEQGLVLGVGSCYLWARDAKNKNKGKDYRHVEWHEKEWQNISSQKVLRIPKEESGLPRTIHIFRAYGRVCVQVLCKTKNGLSIIGQGQYKKGKISIEWRTKTLWVEYTVHRQQDLDFIRKGQKNHDKIGCQVGIFPSSQGRLIYRKKDGNQNYSFFSPLRNGEASNYLTELRQQKMSVTLQVLNILNTLERCRIMHNDIKFGNFLTYRDKDQQIQIELNDFDFAESCPIDLKDARKDCWGYDKTKNDFRKAADFLEVINQGEYTEIGKIINKLRANNNSDYNYSAYDLLTSFKSLKT